MKYFYFTLILSFLTMGCDSQIEGMVVNGKAPNLPVSTISSGDSRGFKASPGANTASGSQLKGRFAITTTKKALKGTQVNAQISFHQNRTN